MIETEFEIHGLKDAIENFKEFPRKLKRRGIIPALRKGAAVVRDAAKKNAKRLDDPETQRMIHKNISTRVLSKRSRQVGGFVVGVGVRGGAKKYVDNKKNQRAQRVGKKYKTLGSASNPGGDTWYWRFLEFGTRKMAARPFLRPALSGNIEPATTAVVNELNVQIDKITEGL